MREIKFRAWDNRTNSWYRHGSGFSIAWDATEIYDDNGDMEYTEDIIVFQQFTGLKDKNGKEIYEGDIMESSINKMWFNWLVEYYDGGFKVVNIGIDGMLIDRFPLTQSASSDREVIGNIYEHPELLKSVSIYK